MNSEGNQIQPVEPKLCANGCGFFGSAATMNMCSKCYRYHRTAEEQSTSAKSEMEKLVNPGQKTAVPEFSADTRVGSLPDAAAGVVVAPSAEAEVKAANRCSSCRKKVGVLGFRCRCGATFCGTHRYPEDHDCSFDFKAVGREAIAKSNPVVKRDKVVRI